MAGGLLRGGAAVRLRGAGADSLEPMARLEAAPRDWATRTGGTEQRRPTATLQPAANERCEGPSRCVAVRWRRWRRWFGQRRSAAVAPRARLGLAMADEHCCARHPRDGASEGETEGVRQVGEALGLRLGRPNRCEEGAGHCAGRGRRTRGVHACRALDTCHLWSISSSRLRVTSVLTSDLI